MHYDQCYRLPKLEHAPLVGVDVSGSMHQMLHEHGGLYLHEAAACIGSALTAMNPRTQLYAFDYMDHFTAVDVVGRRVDDIAKQFRSMGGGGTDLSIPVRLAQLMDAKPKLIVILTDNETWAGHQHCDVAWQEYREVVPDAQLVIASMTANRVAGFDPAEGSILQVAGFDAALPNVIATFAGFSEAGEPEL